MKYILALDQGTTSSRAVIVDRNGKIINIAQKEFGQIFPRPGWVEHDPEEIWSTQLEVLSSVIEKSGITKEDIAAIGITNQRETTVVWDRKTGRSLYNAIVWQDRRTAGECRRLRNEGHEETFRKKTGLLLDPYFCATKIRWILQNTEGAMEKARRGELAFGTIDSWLIWKLTGGQKHITDVSNASRTLIYNIHTGRWDDELMDILDIPHSMLPEVVSSSEVYAETSGDLLSRPVPVSGMAGDQQAALFGQMCTDKGMIKTSYGTGGFMLMNTGDRAVLSENKLLTTVAWHIGEKTEYALEGSIFIAGAVVQWLRDGLGLIKSSSEVEELARTVKDNGGVYLVPAFTGLGAPHWDPGARGAILGITRGTNKGHIARAALESIAYQVIDVAEAMEKDSGLKLEELRADGGASMNNLLMQLQADLMKIPVVRPGIHETTVLGAAFLAGLGCGYWNNIDEIRKLWTADRRFTPEMKETDVDKLKKGWKKALERSLAWETE